MFKSGYEATKTLNISKGQTINLWFHKNYTIDQLSELSYKNEAEKSWLFLLDSIRMQFKKNYEITRFCI